SDPRPLRRRVGGRGGGSAYRPVQEPPDVSPREGPGPSWRREMAPPAGVPMAGRDALHEHLHRPGRSPITQSSHRHPTQNPGCHETGRRWIAPLAGSHYQLTRSGPRGPRQTRAQTEGDTMKNTGKRIHRSILGVLAAAALAASAFAQDQAAPASAVTGINLAESSELGQFLTDQNGMALYLFLPDAQGASTCYDDCATNWPPVTVESADALPTLGAGLDQALLGTVERDDGTLQVTYNGWPLYYYIGDMEPGVTNGQGLGGNWFIVNAAGEAIGAEDGM